MSVVTFDQPKRIISRTIADTRGSFSLELVEFTTQDGPAFACRVFSERLSAISDLYDNSDEAMEAGRLALDRAMMIDL